MRGSAWARDKNGMQSSSKVGLRNRRGASRKDITDLNRKYRKRIRKDHKERTATDFHGFTRTDLLLLSIRVDPRESVAEKLTLFYANPRFRVAATGLFPVYSSVTEER